MAPAATEEPSSIPGDSGDENDEPLEPMAASEATVPLSSIFYVMESYKATAVPVSITMILSALATNFIRTEESAKAREQALTSSYSAIAVNEDASSGQQVGIGVINGLIIVGAITVMTFLVVLLYKYRCMCFLKGYLVVSITFLLGYFGGVLFYEAIQRYKLTISKISFALALYNFTIVGVYSIFGGKGVPTYIGQGYLIVISVILSWELANFSDILAWVLLVLLALYDLYAVLTPCGPLNALVKLMGRDNAEQIPALLYEAQLPPEARRQPRQNRRQTNANAAQSTLAQTSNSSGRASQSAPQNGQISNTSGTEVADNSPSLPLQEVRTDNQPSGETNVSQRHHANQQDQPNASNQQDQTQTSGRGEEKKDDDEHGIELVSRRQHSQPGNDNTATAERQELPALLSQSRRELIVSRSQDEFETVDRPRGSVPLAIAVLYKLPLVDGRATNGDYSVDELKSLVDVYYPRNGGRMERVPTPPPVEPESSRPRFRLGRTRRREEEPPQPAHYNVVDRHNVIKRTIFVGDDGKVYRVLSEQEQEEQEDTSPNSVKLGLGDFIFYSVLVSKASTHSFTTFAACMLAILTGLFLTLLILAIRKKALPALPISIFLGVLFYLPTRFVLEPFIHNMFWAELYF